MIRTLGTACLIAGLATGCNHDNVRADQQAERNDLAREHTAEQHELTMDQREVNKEHAQVGLAQDREREDLRQVQADERQEERAEAREDLVQKTNELSDNREEFSQEVRDLNALVAQACVGVTEIERTQCPLNGERVESINNVPDGVRMKLTPVAGTRVVVEQRVGCYRARAEIRHSTARLTAKANASGPAPMAMANDCVLNQPGLELEVTEADGTVAIELTTDTASRVRELRAQARAIVTVLPSHANRAGRSGPTQGNLNATVARTPI